MRFYLTLKSNMKLKETPPIDYIYLKVNGKEVFCDWDEQDGCMEDNFLHYRMKGIYFDGEYANGMLEDCPEISAHPDIVFEEHDMWNEMENSDDFEFEIVHFFIEDGDVTITSVLFEEEDI